MCSISGIINGTGIEKMVGAQRHRAPDGSGIYRDEHIELGMGRLKIIDLQSPGLTLFKKGDLILCYNGEIYNYLELKKELSAKGYSFHTTSDTEVLLTAWEAWGVKMFDKLNGMYAFAIYNSKEKKLILARDIVGEKPLYYYQSGKKFIFASEAKAVAEVVEVKPQASEFFEAFQHCLIETTWQNVKELPPAHYLTYDINSGETKLVEYWKFKRRDVNLETAEEEFEALLKDAVKLRVRSDVPYALYYSGGIDSSLIGALHEFDHKFYFDNQDESLKEKFFRELPKVLRHLDFPVGSFGFFGMWKLAEIASKKVKVIVSGEGSDEIFGGYVRYLPIARDYELRKNYPSYDYLFSKHERHPDYLTAFAHITARNGNVSYVKEKLRPYFEMFDDPINAMGFADFKLILPSLMQMGDRMASAFGIENRCAFLDKRIIEFGFSLPPEYKIKGLEAKLIPRRVAVKLGLEKAVSLEKKGMAIPYNKWINQPGWDRTHYFQFLKDVWKKNWN